jgi:hypothetical protein
MRFVRDPKIIQQTQIRPNTPHTQYTMQNTQNMTTK